jgi:hypothetical protein
MNSKYSDFTKWALDDARTLDERYLIFLVCEATRYIEWHRRPLEYRQNRIYRHFPIQDWKLFQLNPLLAPEYSAVDTERAMAMMPYFTNFKPDTNHDKRQLAEVSSVLRFFPALEEVSLGWTSLRDLSFVEALPNLRSLQISSGELEDLGPFRKCPNLRHLNLQFGSLGTPHFTPPIYWVDGRPLGALAQLESLTLSPNPAILEGLKFPVLHKAEFSGGSCIQPDCQHLPDMPALRLLTMDHVQSLRGIGRFPGLWHLKVSGPLRDFAEVETLRELTCLELHTQMGWPRKVAPLAALPELLWARFLGEVPRNYWPLAAAPKLCQLEVHQAAAVQLEVQAINAALTPWDAVFALPTPRPLAPLRFVAVDLGGDKSVIPQDATEPIADYVAHPKRHHLESMWMRDKICAATRRVAGEDAIGPYPGPPSEGHWSRGLGIQLQTLGAAIRLPEVLEAIRCELAQSGKDWLIQIYCNLRLSEREMSDQEKRWLKQVQESNQRWQAAQDADDSFIERYRKTQQHLIDTQFRLRVSEEEGEEPDPEEFQPPEQLLPESPETRALVTNTGDVQPPAEEAEPEENPDFELKPFDEQEQNTPAENDADDGSTAVKPDPDPPEYFWEDPYSHPLADSYRFTLKLTLDAVYHDGYNLATVMQMMRREPDEFHPAPPKSDG